MALTVARIAALAFDGVAGAITDAVHAATLSHATQGAYNATTGAYATTPVSDTGRLVVADDRPARDIFPDTVIGPGDEMLMLEGFTETPEEGWTVTAAGKTWIVVAVKDIAAAGTLWHVLARVVPE